MIGLTIDYTITIGNMIEIATIAGGGIWVLIKSDVDKMQKEIIKIGDVLTQLAVTKTRLDNMETDIRELRHGHGFVQGPTGIDREYP